MDNRRVPAVLSRPIEHAFLARTGQLIKPTRTAIPLTLRIDQLKVDEVTRIAKEQGTAQIAITLLYKQASGGSRIIGTAEGEATKGAVDASGKLGNLIRDAYILALEQFEAGDWKDVIAGAAYVSTDEAPTFTRTVVLPEGRAAYTSTSNFSSRNESPVPFELKSKSMDQTFCKIIGVDKQKPPPALIVVVEGDVYIAQHLYNGGMSTKKIFRKAKHVGRYIYLEDQWSSQTAGAAFGMIGHAVSMRNHGVVIDPMNGQITDLTSETLANLATGHDDLEAQALLIEKRDIPAMEEIIVELNHRYQARN